MTNTIFNNLITVAITQTNIPDDLGLLVESPRRPQEKYLWQEKQTMSFREGSILIESLGEKCSCDVFKTTDIDNYMLASSDLGIKQSIAQKAGAF